ncbi:MAG: hypothetical protein AAF703_03030 [Cyanobacteria bacterium P01_D01_bin.105]
MASPQEIKKYLAHWFQLGKQVLHDNGQTRYKPETVIQGDHFSPEFNQCWEAIMAVEGRALYLEGTQQTIAELLSPAWEMTSCARCDMPVPIPQIEITERLCPCNDLPTWPNEELPRPHLPIDSHQKLGNLRKRLVTHLPKH